MEGLTMEERVQKQEKLTSDHEKRIKELEDNYGKLETRMTDIELGQKSIENTVLKESSSQKELTNTLLAHVMNQNTLQLQTKGEVSKLKITSWRDIIIAVLGGGGLTAIIGALFGFWGS